ncbi:MAG: SRPBCC domain-containing protein [Gemmatimonadetes bacterium]|nr:SRPBCC domain-containing protein [Gemmatimonadota bacterium]
MDSDETTEFGVRVTREGGVAKVPAHLSAAEAASLPCAALTAWSALVTKGVVDREFELEMTSADADWKGSRIGFHLEERDGMTHVRFHHTGWPHSNSHFRTSSFCWAMYLRLLKRYVEHGEIVAYEDRLNA